MRIRDKMNLVKTIREANFKTIAIWRNGLWAKVDSGYGGEKSGNNPVKLLKYSDMYDITLVKLDKELKEIERSF